jgi:hypothetical protein
MNETIRKIIIIGSVLFSGIALVFVSAFLLRFLSIPWVVLISGLIGFLSVWMSVRHAGSISNKPAELSENFNQDSQIEASDFF